ncbi:MAG: hypothetical protein GXO87_10600 [Chlorobi bacterium]|nr:hypothetical protein [Chlorobiota bacterium]
MKRLLIACLLFAVSATAQNNKGRISLTFNGEKIDLPISTIMMQKNKLVRISVRAEKNDEEIQQLIALDLTLDKLSLENGDPMRSQGFKLKVSSRKNQKKGGRNVSSDKSFLISLVDKDEALRFSLSEGGEKLTWTNLRSVKIKMNITKIVFQNSSIKISGEFSASLQSGFDSFKGKEVAKIENGRFEIVI